MSADFIERIKKICEIAGNPAKLAKKTGITANAIRSYISTGREPSRKNLIAMAEATEVNLLWLATGEGPMKKGQEGGGLSNKDKITLEIWMNVFEEMFPDFECLIRKK